ncbi:MAG: carbohydrate-binding protein, partial [Saccharofermentanales bacterium]
MKETVDERVSLAEKIEIRYKGLLARAGANRIYLHCGFGPEWKNIRDIAMNRDDDNVWKTTLELKDG